MATTTSIALPFQFAHMTPTEQALVSFLARYTGGTHKLYAYSLRRWFDWCGGNGLDPLEGIQRAHVELYVRHLGESDLAVSAVEDLAKKYDNWYHMPNPYLPHVTVAFCDLDQQGYEAGMKYLEKMKFELTSR